MQKKINLREPFVIDITTCKFPSRKSISELVENFDTRELLVNVITDGNSSASYTVEPDPIGRMRQIADGNGCSIVYVCLPLGCSNPDQVIEEVQIAGEWCYSASKHNIWSDYVTEEMAISIHANSHEDRESLDQTMREVLLCDAIVITSRPDYVIESSVAFKFGCLRMMPIFDVSSSPVRRWNYDKSCFDEFCLPDHMYSAINAVLRENRDECCEEYDEIED